MFRRLRAPWRSAVLLALALAATTSCGSGYGDSPTTPIRVRELDSPNLAPGARFEHRFAAAGSFPYHCIHHAPMTGSVQVNANAADTLVNVSIISDTSPFPAASVKPGGRVVWINNTQSIHTVTSD